MVFFLDRILTWHIDISITLLEIPVKEQQAKVYIDCMDATVTVSFTRMQ